MFRFLVLQLIVSWVGLKWVIRRRRRLEARSVAEGRRLPKRLRSARSDRTWILVTASSPGRGPDGPDGAGPAVDGTGGGDVGDSVEQRLRELDPGAHITHLQVPDDPELAQLLRAEKLPTLILADRRGWVRHRVDGPRAVLNHLDS